ncbi:MAG: hypothetical protein JNM49_03645, partial [Flavobacteriales bacterium]|nr:hypothetical protein [Flavobacteriales bacterium]
MKRWLLTGILMMAANGMAKSDDAAKGNNAFAFSLMPLLMQGEENLIFSPFSVWTALAMTSAGAEGETLKEMHSTLRLPRDGYKAHSLAGGWAKELANQKEVELNVANRLWGAQGLPFVS